MFATPDPLGAQFGMDTWTVIDLPALLMGVVDLLGQALIFQLALTGYSLVPGIIATFRHAEHTTHRFHGILLLMLGNKLIPPSYVLENTIKAFLKCHAPAVSPPVRV